MTLKLSSVNKQVLLTLTILLLVLAACGGSNSTNTAGLSFTISGSAVKGVIANGIVNVYSNQNLSTPVYTAADRTAADGSYVLTVPTDANFAGEAVIVEITAGEDDLSTATDETSTMVCDANIVEGCTLGSAHYEYGDTMVLPAGFSLQAVIVAPPEDESVIVNISGITNIVSRLAQESNVNAETIDRANRQVAALLNVGVSDFSQVRVIDITVAGELALGSATEKKLGLLSAALLDAALKRNNTDLGNATSELTGLLVEGITTDVSILATTVESLLLSAVDLAQSSADAGASATSLVSDLVLVQSGELSTTAASSPHAGLSGVAQAKAFMADLRNLNVALDHQTVAEDVAPFEDSVDAARTLVTDDTEVLLSVVAQATLALEQAASEFNANTTLVDYRSSDGILVSITPGAETLDATFRIDNYQSADGTTINLTGVFSDISIARFGGDTGDQVSGAGQLSITGSAGNSAVELILESVDVRLVNFSRARPDLESSNFIEEIQITATKTSSRIVDERLVSFSPTRSDLQSSNFGREIQTTATKISLKIRGILSQINNPVMTSPVVFKGNLHFDIFSYDNLFTYEFSHSSFNSTDNAVFDSANLTLYGDLSHNDKHVGILVSIMLDGTGYIAGDLPIGFIRQNYAQLSVEESGKIAVFNIPSLKTVSRLEYLSVQEVLDRGLTSSFYENYGGGDALLFQSTVDGRRVLADEFSLTSFSTADGDFLYPASITTLLGWGVINNALDFYNESLQSGGRFIVEGEGVYKYVLPNEEELGLEGGSINAELLCTGYCDITGSGSFFEWIEPDIFTDNESNTLKGDFLIRLNTNITGIGDESGVDIRLAGSKLDVSTFDAGLEISYAGRNFNFTAGVFDIDKIDSIGNFTVINQDKLTLAINRNSEGNISGSISRDGDEFAILELNSNDVLIIRYKDGSFESAL